MLKLNSSLKTLFVLAAITLLAACGSTPQPIVQLSANTMAKPGVKVGYVFVTPKGEATTHIAGAGCLLCYGVASALTSKLDSHLEKNVDNSELKSMSDVVKAEYAEIAPSFTEVSLPTPIDSMKKFKGENGFAKKDFRSLKDTLGIDVLVVFQIDAHGAYRGFNGYVPTSDPQGHISGLLYAVDLENNGYLQYMPLVERVQPEGEWDEPPTFPSVTTSYYQAVENIKQRIRRSI